MNTFEQYQKNWKESKSSATNTSSQSFSTLKNKTIMQQLLAYELQEKQARKKGLIGGAMGIGVGSLCGLSAMYWSAAEIPMTMISGTLLMVFSLFFSFFQMKERAPTVPSDLSSIAYLKQRKQHLLDRAIQNKQYMILYVVLIMFGLSLVIFEFALFIAIAGVLMGIVLYYTWNATEDPHTQKRVVVLEQMIKELEKE